MAAPPIAASGHRFRPPWPAPGPGPWRRGSLRCSRAAARSGSRPARRSTGPGGPCGGCRARNGDGVRVPTPSSATSHSSGRGRRSAARNRDWRRARRRPACRGPRRPIIMTSVAVIAIWARLVRTIGQLSESVARISSRQGVSGASAPASIADMFRSFRSRSGQVDRISLLPRGEPMGSSRSPALLTENA